MTDIIVQQGGTNVVVGAPATTKVVVQQGGSVGVTVAPGVRTAVIEQPVAIAVEHGIQGIPGPPGADGGSALVRVAASDLGGHRVVRAVDATLVEYADCSNPLHGDDTLGVTDGAALAGSAINVRTSGELFFNGWAWMAGEQVYLGNNGILTQVPPADGFVQVIGFAQDPTTIFIGVQAPIYFE